MTPSDSVRKFEEHSPRKRGPKAARRGLQFAKRSMARLIGSVDYFTFCVIENGNETVGTVRPTISTRPTFIKCIPLTREFTFVEVHGLAIDMSTGAPSTMNMTKPSLALDGMPQRENEIVWPTADGFGVDVNEEGLQIFIVEEDEFAGLKFESPL